MHGQLSWTAEALDWLEDIYRYIAADNPVAAAKVIGGIAAKAELLMRFPDIGSRLCTVAEGDVRMVLYGHYRLVYLHRGDEEIVEVLGVFHCALDIDRYLS